MKMDLRLITAVIAVLLASTAVAEAAHSRPLDETPLSRYSSAPLNATKSTKSEYQWIASRTAPKRRRTLILNSFFVKSTIQNAAAILQQVLLLIVTASIAVPGKSSSGKQLKTNGTRIRARKLSSVRTQVALAEASAIMR